ncbi:MAG: RNA pseudouridine synthase [Tannerellaceae bacterium]|nr:RNA pseudouridine synthase [Tannerellaceae bacterium]
MGQRSNYHKRRKPGASKGRNIIVEEAGTLLPFLLQAFNQQSKSSVKALLKHRQVSVNGKVTTQFDVPVNKGDQVTISYERGKVEFTHPLLRIVWEDELLIVVDKSEGLLAAGNNRVKERTAFSLLAEFQKKQDPRSRLFLLNPLDRETSGLMLFARNRGVQQLFLDEWNRRVSFRSFMTVVEGKPEKTSRVLSTVKVDAQDSKVLVAAAGDSRQTIIRYNVIKSNNQ